MSCISPPQPADIDLLAYLDGESDDQVTTHLERCPHCRERARKLGHLQDHLTARLYRYNCPSTAELGDYHLGLLPQGQEAALAHHLTECPRCAYEVSQLEAYLADLAPALEQPGTLEQVTDRVRVLVARLVNGGMTVDLPGQPALVGVRGDEREPLIYEADGVQVVLEVDQDPDQPERRSILGLVIGVDDPGQLDVHLWRSDQPVATIQVEDVGNFVISNLAPGRYELIVSGPELEIHIQELEVEAR
jgi:anti-sigma factor RsiW